MIKVYTTYGLFIAIALIVFFLLTKIFGLHQYPMLSSFNAVFYAAGIYLALKKFQSAEGELKYEKGFELGMFTGGIATVIFTAFMAIYMYQFDQEFARAILDTWKIEFDSGTFTILVTIATMGAVTSLFVTFSFMQLFKRSWNTKDGNRNTL